MCNAKKLKAVPSTSTDATEDRAQLEHRVEEEHEIQGESESSLVGTGTSGTDHDEAAQSETIEQTCPAADISMNYNICGEEEEEEEEVDPQDVFDDWVMGLQKGDRKMLAVCLFTTFQKRQKISVMDGAQEAASITGFNKRTVRACAKEFQDNNYSFKETRQGKYERVRRPFEARLVQSAVYT